MGRQDLALKVLLQAQDQASGTLKGFGSTLINLAGAGGPLLKVLLGISAAGVGVAVASTQMAAQYQQQMLKNRALAGLTADQYNQFYNSILDLAPQVGKAPLDLAQGLYYVLSAGVPASQALEAVRQAAMLAATGMTSTQTTANALTNVMKVFGLSSRQAADQITLAVAQGKMTMEQYANTIGKLSLTAKSSNRSLYETNAALDTLTNNGFPSAAQASTGLQNLFTQMDIKVDTLAQRFDKMQPVTYRYVTVLKDVHGQLIKVQERVKVTSNAFDEQRFKTMTLAQQVAYLNQITHGNTGELLKLLGGSRQALQAFQALSQHTGEYTNHLQDMAHASDKGGAAAAAFAITQKGFTQQMAQASAAVQALMIKLGTLLLPILTKLVSFVAPVIAQLGSWIDFIQKNKDAQAILFGALVAFAGIVFALVLPAFIAWATAAGAAAIATIAATWPILAIGLVVGAVVAGIILAVQHWGAIMKWLQWLWGVVFDALKGAFKVLAVVALIALAPILWPIYLIIFLITHWGQVVSWFGNLFHTVFSAVGSFFSGVGSTIHGIVTKIGDAFSGLGSFLQKLWRGAQDDFRAFINWIISGINFFINAWNGFHIDVPAVNLGPIHMGGGSIRLPQIPDIPLLASGGITTRSGLFTVGERGSENVWLPGGATVFPHGAFAGQGSSGGRGHTITNYWTITGANAEEIARKVEARLSNLLRRSGNMVNTTFGGKA